MKKIIKHILLILWCLLIFFFSSENGELSSNRSKTITNNVVDTYEKVFNDEIKEKDKVVDDVEIVIRKVTHFGLYFILGILVLSCFSEYPLSFKKQIIFSVLFCFLYAASDEFHQLFSSGRGGRILDVFIDTSGSITGITIVSIFKKRHI